MRRFLARSTSGHTLATIAQAYIYTKFVAVEVHDAALMILAACAAPGSAPACRPAGRGGRYRSAWASRSSAQRPLADAGLRSVPGGGDTLGLTRRSARLGLAGNFVLGALMMLGVGLYGPCMILVSLLGMNPTAAFPIMMGSCAFLMPVASAALHTNADLPHAGGVGPDARRRASCPDRGLSRGLDADRVLPLAGHRRCRLHVAEHAAHGET